MNTAIDPALAPTPSRVVDSMEAMSGGPHPGYRRSGARGVCLQGTFTPSGAAAAWTSAAHLQDTPVPVVARFSNSEGDPLAPDNIPVARGLAVRFRLPGGDTDLIGLSVPRFVAATPQEFVELTGVLRPDPLTGVPDMAAVGAWVGAHPHLAEPIGQQPPIPAGYDTAAYWAIHAFIWVDQEGRRQPVRYRWEPEAGRIDLTAEEAAARTAHYLTEALRERLEQGAVAFTLRVQLGEEGDPTHDPTVLWPEERKELSAGVLVLTAPADDPGGFDPTRLTAGVELSDDPVLAFRGRAYQESAHRRTENR